jgi:hypothetical protein
MEIEFSLSCSQEPATGPYLCKSTVERDMLRDLKMAQPVLSLRTGFGACYLLVHKKKKKAWLNWFNEFFNCIGYTMSSDRTITNC